MRRAAGYTPEESLLDANRLAELMSTLNELAKPTIARVQGAAYGGGEMCIRDSAHSVYRACFAEGRDISQPDVVLELAARQGADRATLSAALNSQALKERLKAECDAALGKGVFGSPYIIVDGEPFFGADRLPQIERWLASGGF